MKLFRKGDKLIQKTRRKSEDGRRKYFCLRSSVFRPAMIIITGFMIPCFSFSQDLFSLLDDFLKKSQTTEEYAYIQVSRTFEKGKTDALLTETSYFYKKGNSTYMKINGEGMEMEIVSNGKELVHADKTDKTIAVARINGDSIWSKTQNTFLQFKQMAESASMRDDGKTKIFTIHPKKEYQTMYDSIVYRWNENILRKMEIYPAKQFQSLIASNDDYTENPDGSDIQRAATKDIHWEIVYEQLDKFPFAPASVDNYLIKQADGKYELTGKYKGFALMQ